MLLINETQTINSKTTNDVIVPKIIEGKKTGNSIFPFLKISSYKFFHKISYWYCVKVVAISNIICFMILAICIKGPLQNSAIIIIISTVFITLLWMLPIWLCPILVSMTFPLWLIFIIWICLLVLDYEIANYIITVTLLILWLIFCALNYSIMLLCIGIVIIFVVIITIYSIKNYLEEGEYFKEQEATFNNNDHY